MNRRSFLKTATTVGAAVSATAVTGQSATRKPRQAVVILGESVRYDMLNCNKQTGLKTPNLDRIAREGIRFEKAYNVQPVCSPARGAIWTGLYPHTNCVWGNSMPLADTTHTIGQRLSDHGIQCGFIGKWHLSGTDYFDTGKPAPGWNKDFWYDGRTYLGELTPRDRPRARDPKSGLDGSWPAEKCYGRRCTDRAVRFLDQFKDHDFLLVVSYDEPHHPWLCPTEFSDMYKGFDFPKTHNTDDPLTTKPELQQIWARAKNVNAQHPIHSPAQYFGSHTFIDHEIGTLLNKLDHVAPEALVMYTADHGIFLDSHCLIDKGPVMYDEITHIPFVARWKGHTPAGAVTKSLASHIDIHGTLMEFFGHEVPKTVEGKSLLSILKDPHAKVRDEAYLEFGRYSVDQDGFGGFQCVRAVTDGRYKLTINLMSTDEFYDLDADRVELDNLIHSTEHAAARNRLHDKLLQHMNTTRDPFRGYYWGRRAWRPDWVCEWENDGYARQRENDGYLPRELDYNTGQTMAQAQRIKI